jgi:uncharacterized membrane protein
MKYSYKKLISYFFRGLLFVVPITLTVYVIVLIINFLDNLISFPIPGIGIIIMISFIIFIGYLASTIFTKPLFDEMEKWLLKIPVISILYTSIKDLMSAFVGDKKKFNVPVIVEFSTNIYRLGFITQDDLSLLEEPALVAVYMPHSYNFSGNLYLVPRSKTRVLQNVNSADVMKFIVSGGVSNFQPLTEIELDIKKPE